MSLTIGEKALATFLKNDSWREYYEQAPSDACRKCIEGEFVRSLYSNCGEEYSKERLEAPLCLADWKWLYKWCGNNPRKGFIARKIAELEAAKPETKDMK